VTLPAKNPLAQTAVNWFNAQGRQDYALYITKLDALITALAAGNVGTLVNAANDVAARNQGVALGALYRNGNVIQVRLT
jgi:uncharacterized protein YgbK (DUF1537 family)